MKICRVKITKEFDGHVCRNIYPDGYDANKINIITYDEKPLNNGNNIGYCIGLVDDDFQFTDDMKEVNRKLAEKFIDDRSDVEKDDIRKNRFKTTRRRYLDDAGL